MTKEEICKVLDCFHTRILETNLAEKVFESEVMAILDAIGFIKELTEENEKLTINMNAYGLTAKRLSEENERLRADTVREMQKRLTNLFSNDENLEYIEVDAEYINEQIDKIANEMIGETK